MTLRADTDAALATERASYDVEISTLRAENEALNSQIASLEGVIQSLQNELDDCNSPGVVQVPAGSDLQTYLSDNPEGTVFQLENNVYYGLNLTPKNGQVVRGPAKIRPTPGGVRTNDDGFRMKASGQVFDVVLVDLDIAGFGRHGVGAWIGTTIQGGRIHHNGKDGVGGDLEGLNSNILLDHVELDLNGQDPDWWGNSGGVKMFHTHGFTAVRCHVHDNIGNGIWGDAQCGDMDILDCIITDNTRKGVFYEKGGEGDGSFLNREWAVYNGQMNVIGCTIQRNNKDGNSNAHAGVSLYSSKNVLVENCVFGDNGRAIIVRDDPKRLVDDKHGWVPENIILRGNTLNGDEVVGCGLPGVVCE